MGSLS